MSSGDAMRLILSEILDIYPTNQQVSQLVTNGKVNTKKLLEENTILHLSVVYGTLWNFIYKTYPTKKDFTIFFTSQPDSLKSQIGSDQVADQILNSFFPLKLGLVANFQLPQVAAFYKETCGKLRDNTFITNYIYDKLMYRYQIPKETFTSSEYTTPNIILTVLNVIKKSKSKLQLSNNITTHINPISTSFVQDIVFSKEDQDFMSEQEKTQYIIMQDMHFLRKLIGNSTIFLDVTTIPMLLKQTLQTITESIDTEHLNIFYDTNNSMMKEFFSTECKDFIDPHFTFPCSSKEYHLLPQISKHHITISSQNIQPQYKPLCVNPQNAIYTLFDPAHSMSPLASTFTNYYNRCVNISSKLSFQHPSLKTYIAWPEITSISDSSDSPSSTPLSVYISKKDIESLNNKVDFSKLVVNHEIQQVQTSDIVIDIDGNIDPCVYLPLGCVPILKHPNSLVHHAFNGFIIPSTNNNVSLEEYIAHTLQKLMDNHEHLIAMKRINRNYSHLCRKDMAQLVWKTHFKSSCPHKSMNTKNSILIFFDFTYKYFAKKLVPISSNDSASTNVAQQHCVFLIDNRSNPLSILSTLFTMANIEDHQFALRIYTSKSALSYYKEHLGHIAQIYHLPQLDKKKFHIDIYNSILMDPTFWKDLLSYQKCLIIQDDGLILRPGVSKFLDYDFLGAPWAPVQDNDFLKAHTINMIGNGGLSLRNIKLMHDITTKYEQEKKHLFYKNVNNIPEDVYFATCIKKYIQEENRRDIKIPTPQEALQFSSEEALNMDCIGVHKMWVYQHPEHVQTYFAKLLA